MKTFTYIVLLLTLLALPVLSQKLDTLKINFEVSSGYIQIDTSNHNNIWQIGIPSKNFFSSAYDGVKAIVTDTSEAYPVNNTSSFIIVVDSMYNDCMGLHLSFWHKFDTDTLQDNCLVEASYDDGVSWNKLIDKNYGQDTIPPQRGYWSHMDASLTQIWTMNHPFSGNSVGWILSSYYFWWYSIVTKSENLNETIKWYEPINKFLIRFSLYSDSINSNKEGWMIDQVEIKEDDDFIGIKTYSNNPIQINIYPNPCHLTSQVLVDDIVDVWSYKIIDVTGRVQDEKMTDNNKFIIYRNNLKNGIYFLQIATKDRRIISKRFIVN